MLDLYPPTLPSIQLLGSKLPSLNLKPHLAGAGPEVFTLVPFRV